MTEHEHGHDHHHHHDHNHDHDCDCGHEHEEQVFLIKDESGKELEMVMVYHFETDDQPYAVLLDRNDPEGDGVIFRIQEEDDAAYLVSIEDNDEWERVVQVYNQKVEAEQGQP